MDHEPDIERRYGFHRILTLVSGDDTHGIDQRASPRSGRVASGA